MSIIGIPVRIMRFGVMRFDGLTEGPPISTRLSTSAGPWSRGSAEPLKMRPSKSSLNETFISCPKKRIWSFVETPRPPANTWSEMRSPSILFTSARDFPNLVVISASSLSFTPFALTVITLPLMLSILLYTLFITHRP